jgi:hypothetical protein
LWSCRLSAGGSVTFTARRCRLIASSTVCGKTLYSQDWHLAEKINKTVII